MRHIFYCALCLLLVSHTLANPQKPAKVAIAGKYGDLRLSEMSGDPVGMEIVITARRGGYYATVLKPESSLGRPVTVKLRVKGSQIRFTLSKSPGGTPRRFEGRVTARGLVGKFEDEQRVSFLRREESDRQ